jgi:excisionase family DNA binding protein
VPIEPNAIYSMTEVAALLKCGKSNVYDLASQGDLAVVRIGAGRGGIRVMGSDLLAFLASRREGGAEPKKKYRHLQAFLS